MYIHVPYLSYSEDSQSFTTVCISTSVWLINLFPHIIQTEGSPLSCICSHPSQGDITQPAIPRSLQPSLPARVLNQNSKQSFCVPYIYKRLDHFSLFDLTIQGEKHKSLVNTISFISHLLQYLSNISPKTKNHINS